VDIKKLKELFEDIKAGRIDDEGALKKLRHMPFEDIAFARIDHHRSIRCGFPEVIFGGSKSPTQIATLAERLIEAGSPVLATRISEETALHVIEIEPRLKYDQASRVLFNPSPDEIPITGKGTILIITAGTGDIPVAEEAVFTARMMGNKVEKLFDVGVAGIHRLLDSTEAIEKARVIIVVAGMEGALPSVIAGISGRPIVAVPTSIGYGASFAGIAALLGMLNSCAGGVSVVNIDNGFGAAYMASLINHPPEISEVKK